ncbi:Multidrug resistance protein MdtG [Candidatus Bilamarchaeum dharawalense]|uniref:Multidrug resistance protein MdtG n=1 Tax=Candidatus Bilamarchaeum dharawalense TaxID=2885759 RepID=A0A5E4LS77_9ARCH|nr:Multidrug resistance protein MdtG [Candidatus Bilamarchaeum dharawalense]
MTMGKLDRNVIALGLVSFFTDVSSEMIFPILPLFLNGILGVGKEIIGLIEGVADSISSLLDIFIGYFSDRQGRRKDYVIFGYGLSTVLKIGLVFATAWQHVLAIRGLERIGKSIRTSPRDAIIAESSDEKTRGQAFGLHRAMDTLGAIVGPIIAYVILKWFGETETGFRTVFVIAVIPAVLAVLTLLVLVREPKKETTKITKPNFWESLRMLDGRYKKFLAISCFFSLAYFSYALLIVRANDIGIKPEDVVLIYVFYNIIYALISVPIGKLSDRIGRKFVIAASFILYAVICLGFIVASQFWQVVLLFVLYAIFVAADESVNKAYISDISGNRIRGIALGAYNSAVGAAYLPASIIFGFLWVVFGVPFAFGAAAVVAIIAGILMLT